MNDLKNISIAWISTTTSLCTAIETKTSVTILSAIVLPVIFFVFGKTVDVLLQIYFRRAARNLDSANSERKDGKS